MLFHCHNMPYALDFCCICEVFRMGDYAMTARECKRKRNRRNISRFDYDIIESDESKKKQGRRKRYEEYFVQKLKEKAIS